ncbi:MAG TPA: hypothetical protein VJ810_15530 [Blastocatellia bacterium]|nr:hypothetical protein [Blastocatellia bacterium]
MKKKLFALSGVLMVALVISGLWATKAINLTVAQQSVEPAATSLVAELSMQEMTEGASMIVTGTCAGTRSQWIGRDLVTVATVSVTETIKGDQSDTLTVVIPGGVDSNRQFPVAVTYPGAPQISPTEEVVLFLASDDSVANGYSVMGYSQGKYSVNESDTGEKVVFRDLTKVRMQTGMGTVRGNIQVVKLSEFIEKVRSYLR